MMTTDFLASERGCCDNKSACEYNYIIYSFLGSNNELHEADIKASYHCAFMLIRVFAGCTCDIVGFTMLRLIYEFLSFLQHSTTV